MGHVSEKSGDVYNQRYIREKANFRNRERT